MITLSEEVLRRGLAVLRILVVARILEPEEIGRFALTAAFLAALELTTNPGLGDAVIHGSREDPDRDKAVWTALVLRGLIIGGLLWGSAPFLATLVARPDISNLIRLVALAPVLQGLSSVSVILAQRDIRFGRLSAVRIGVSIIETITAIWLAYIWETAAALVVGILFGQAFLAVGSYAIPGFHPQLSFEFRRLMSVMSYARWRFASGLAYFAATSADDIALGRISGATSLGYYRVAYQLANVPATSLTSAITVVAFPSFSRLIQRRPDTLADAYSRYLRLVSGVSGFVAGGLATMSSPLIHSTVGVAWGPAVPVLAILCAAGFGRSISATGGVMFLSVGRPSLDTRMQWVRAGVLLPALVLIVPFGAIGAALASLLSVLASLTVWRSGLRLIGFDMRQAYADLAHRLPALMSGGAIGLLAQLMSNRPVPRLVLGSAGYTLAWLGVTAMMDRRLLKELQASLGRLITPSRPSMS